ncbi:protein kinase [Corallococcus sp. Z5C101001]|uniref:protein kinase domain-containing protein n=1 Tax=Corallococcus sp. Z5C101001 TaxID=2596829 RepID=UPI0011800901|nr:protein kinase [Corallococcus sp. Z5C101001]TSC33149.1 protein kinase [Corallococcus sp. Z5C101001]
MQLGKYQLVRKLASGGMAEVFLAKAAGPRGFEKTLVLKRILPHLAEDEAFVEMFLGEAKLAAQLDHPNVVQIFDFGEADGSYFLAMEYIDGPTLRRLIKRSVAQGVPLPWGVCAKMVAAAAEGLAFAHALKDSETGAPLGLVHRDISPENVLVSRQGAVKVVDFGIAKVTGQGPRTQTGVVKGKVAYMPPEQLQARSMDGRVDVYALGMVLYELLTGVRPFEATTDVGMMQAILFEPFVPAVARRSDLPEALQRILERALAKDRDQRYPDCRAFQADLERFVMSLGEPVGAYEIAQLVVRVSEHVPVAPTPPLPVRQPGRGPETAVLQPAGETPAAPVAMEAPLEPSQSRALTTPVSPREGHGGRAARRSVAGAAPQGDQGPVAAPSAPSEGSTAPRLPLSLRPTVPMTPVEEPRASSAPTVPMTPSVSERGPRSSRRARLVVGAALGLLVSAGGWLLLGRSGSVAPAPGARAVEATGADSSEAPSRRAGPPALAAPPVQPPAVAVVEHVDAGMPPGAQVSGEGDGPPSATEASLMAGRTAQPAAESPAVRAASVEAGTRERGSPAPARPVAVRRIDRPRGRVEFRIRPYASIYLDGKPMGQTPFAAIEVPEGTHWVRVVNKDLGKDLSQRFEVKAGQDNIFKLNLLTE